MAEWSHADALTECKNAARPLVTTDRLSDELFESFAKEFLPDFERVFTSESKWKDVRDGLIARARAIVTMADTYAIDMDAPRIEMQHLRHALKVVKEGCRALRVAEHSNPNVRERWQNLYEPCFNVATE